MTIQRYAAGFVSVVVAISISLPARAQSRGAAIDPICVNLIAQGLAAYKLSDFTQAAKVFEQAYGLCPLPAVAYNRSKSLEKLGKLLDAERIAKEARSRPAPSDAEQKGAYDELEKLIADLSSRIPSMTVNVSGVPDGATAVVRIDGIPAPLDRPQRVDPGNRKVSVEVAGRPPVERAVPVKEREARSIDIVLSMLVVGGGGDAQLSATKLELDKARQQQRAQRTLGFVTAGAGLAGLGVGAALGVLAITKNNASNAPGVCDGAKCKTQDGVDLRNSSIAFGNGSTTAFIAGGVVLAAGVVIVVTAPKQTTPAVRVGLGAGSFDLQGTW